MIGVSVEELRVETDREADGGSENESKQRDERDCTQTRW
jgi:hypothetical protein